MPRGTQSALWEALLHVDVQVSDSVGGAGAAPEFKGPGSSTTTGLLEAPDEALPALDMGVASVAAIEPLIRMNVAEASLVERLERRLVAYEHGLDVENYEAERARWLGEPTDEERRELPLAERLERRLEAYQMGLSPD